MHVDGGVAGAGGQQAVQLGSGAVLVMPAQRVDDLVVLLDATQQLQTGSLEHLDTPERSREVRDTQGKEHAHLPLKNSERNRRKTENL